MVPSSKWSSGNLRSSKYPSSKWTSCKSPVTDKLLNFLKKAFIVKILAFLKEKIQFLEKRSKFAVECI